MLCSNMQGIVFASIPSLFALFIILNSRLEEAVLNHKVTNSLKLASLHEIKVRNRDDVDVPNEVILSKFPIVVKSAIVTRNFFITFFNLLISGVISVSLFWQEESRLLVALILVVLIILLMYGPVWKLVGFDLMEISTHRMPKNRLFRGIQNRFFKSDNGAASSFSERTVADYVTRREVWVNTILLGNLWVSYGLRHCTISLPTP